MATAALAAGGLGTGVLVGGTADGLVAAVALPATAAVVWNRLARHRRTQTTPALEEAASPAEAEPAAHGGAAPPAPVRSGASIVDDDTGLPDARYFELALDHRVAAARRHLWPVALVLMEVPSSDDATAPPEAVKQSAIDRLLMAVDDPMAELAHVVRSTLREADTACRVGPRTIALLLEDTTEAGGAETAERLQVAMAIRGVDVREVASGVAAYPTHGLVGDEVLVAAKLALERARATRPGPCLGPVAVAVAPG